MSGATTRDINGNDMPKEQAGQRADLSPRQAAIEPAHQADVSEAQRFASAVRRAAGTLGVIGDEVDRRRVYCAGQVSGDDGPSRWVIGLCVITGVAIGTVSGLLLADGLMRLSS